MEASREVVQLDPGCDDHATGLDWCDRCHDVRVEHAGLQHALKAYDAAKAGKAVE